MAVKLKKGIDFNVEIGLKGERDWNAEKLAQVKAMAKELHATRIAEQILKNNALAIQYQMEAYADSDESRITKSIPLQSFLTAYLGAMGISFRKFAIAIEMNDANLQKYISGDRKFNADLAKKFGRFFHSSPVTWMKVYQLNELIQLRKQPVAKRYDKYDFLKVAHHGSTKRFSGSVIKRDGGAVRGMHQWEAGQVRTRDVGVTIRGKSESRKEVKGYKKNK